VSVDAALAASTGTDAPPAPAARDIPDMTKIFGEDFTKDPALSKFKTPGDVVKSYKELQAQIGKPRFDVPGQDTPQEVASEFWKKLGVPEKPEDYGLRPDANIPELNTEVNAEFIKSLSQVAHELKMTKDQTVGFQKFIDGIAANYGKAQAEVMAQEDAKLDEMFSKAFGDQKAIASERTKQTIEKVLPPELRPLVAGKVENEALLVIAMMEKHFMEKYGQADRVAGDGAAGSGKSVNDLRNEANEIYAKMQKVGPMDPGYRGMKDQYDGIYKTISELTAAQNKK